MVGVGAATHGLKCVTPLSFVNEFADNKEKVLALGQTVVTQSSSKSKIGSRGLHVATASSN